MKLKSVSSILLASAITVMMSGCGENGTTPASAQPTANQSNLSLVSDANSLNLKLDLSSLDKAVTPNRALTSHLNGQSGTLPVESAPSFSKVSLVLTHPIKKIRKVVELEVVDNIAQGTITGLVTGDWDLEATILNQDNETVYTANQQVTIQAGKTTQVALEFEPVDPTGSLEVVVVPKTPFNELEWKPAPADLPASGNYVYLHSQAGDYIGGGQNYLYTDSDINLSAAQNMVSVSVDEYDPWGGSFVLPMAMNDIQVGLYQGLQRYPFNNPVKGGLDWSGHGRGCNTLKGWIAVDKVNYDAGGLQSIDFRFSQHCEGGEPALLGAVHWEAPAGSGVGTNWYADPAVIPATGNYVYLTSDRGDYIGAGKQYLYTPADALMNVVATNGQLSVGIQGDESWDGNFMLPASTLKLTKGLFENTERYPFQSLTQNGLDWSGEGRGCNQSTGWFQIDQVNYIGNALNSIDLRFEQRCEKGNKALRGQIHWTKP